MLGILISGVILAVVVVSAGGSLLVRDQAESIWYSVTHDRHPTPTELILEEFDFASLEPSEPAVSSLGPDDSLSFVVESRGCFHHDIHRLDIRGPVPLSVFVRRLSVDNPEEATSLRHFWLQEAEAVRMDAALTFYRHVDRGNWVCTTKEYISADWQIAGTHRSERFVDGTCLLRYDNPYVLSPGSIAWARAAP